MRLRGTSSTTSTRQRNAIRIPINEDVVEGYLASDNVLNWKVAEFLNTTGQYIHMEITFSQVVFKWVQ